MLQINTKNFKKIPKTLALMWSDFASQQKSDLANAKSLF